MTKVYVVKYGDNSGVEAVCSSEAKAYEWIGRSAGCGMEVEEFTLDEGLDTEVKKNFG